MSMHMAISGLTGFQRSLWMAAKHGKRKGMQQVKEHMEKTRSQMEGPAVSKAAELLELAWVAGDCWCCKGTVRCTGTVCSSAGGVGAVGAALLGEGLPAPST